MRSLVKLNMIDDIAMSDGKIAVRIASAGLNPSTQAFLKRKVVEAVRAAGSKGHADIEFVEKSPKDVNQIGNVVAVMSGKGGVGKSLVTTLIALSLARRGHEVGILDADITGPSIPRMLGIHGSPMGSDSAIMPMLSRLGIEIMSINLLLPEEDTAVIWRGPLIGKTIVQFWEDVVWGKLDYLLVDLPPGTADAPLTVMQSLPLSGVVIAFTPQELAAMVVRKAVSMTRQMNIPVIGVVENMSYFPLPESGKHIELFGKSKAREMAEACAAPLLAQLPIDPQLAQLCDDGEIERYHSDEVGALADAFLSAVESRARQPAPEGAGAESA
jgi:hydrogenase maturation protease